MFDPDRLSDADCWTLCTRLFPNGLDDAAIGHELTRRGYRGSERGEPADLLGRCLWDIYSNNHKVLTADGRAVDLGSFRAAAAFLAAFRSRREANVDAARDPWDYLDFHMATLGKDADCLSPVYELIFTRMREAGLDWRYVHRRLYVIDFSGWDEEAGRFEDYDASRSVEREAERKRRAAETTELRAELDRLYRESVEEARTGAPPPVVRSYARVYGRHPDGWPPA